MQSIWTTFFGREAYYSGRTSQCSIPSESQNVGIIEELQTEKTRVDIIELDFQEERCGESQLQVPLEIFLVNEDERYFTHG